MTLLDAWKLINSQRRVNIYKEMNNWRRLFKLKPFKSSKNSYPKKKSSETLKNNNNLTLHKKILVKNNLRDS